MHFDLSNGIITKWFSSHLRMRVLHKRVRLQQTTLSACCQLTLQSVSLAESVYTKVVNFHQPMVTSSFMKWLFGTFPSTKVQHVLTYIEHNVVHNSTKSSSLICWNGFVLQRLIRYRRISIGLTHLYTFILLYFLLDLNIFNNTNVLCEII